MKFKWVGTWEERTRVLRLFRVTWTRGTVGDGNSYSAKFSVALRPVLFSVRQEWQSVCVTVLGLRVHFQRSYGGIFV
jgi:hypothetical protein